MTETRATYHTRIGLRQPEKDIQEACSKLLALHGFTVFSFAAPGTHGRLCGSVPDGWPDTLNMKGGAHLFIEYKRLGERLTPTQTTCHALLRRHFCRVYVVSSLQDVVNILAEHDIEARVAL